MRTLLLTEQCAICGEGVVNLQHDILEDGKPIYYRECNFCGSDYAGKDWKGNSIVEVKCLEERGMNMRTDLYLGDCLEVMGNLSSESVDLVLTDPPYGTTACKWDSIIPFDAMWGRLYTVTKQSAPIVIFGNEPFSSALRLSNIRYWKYDWIWHKSKCGSAFTSKFRPQQKHEIVSVFGEGKVNYYPQMETGKPYVRHRKANLGDKPNNHSLGVVSESVTVNTGFRYPSTVRYFQQKWRRQDQLHPTQKPVALMEYLIRTYTKEGDTVLDFTMGSGTTGVACKNLNRNFIGIEKDEKYFEIAKKRINETPTNL